ncbi:exonuclease [Phanerochaete sordida]|uniref:Mitochondrial escape protein 2 n=1 Tax=Phanerochaete sordida TaxID=48140 RepID=A0A9P3G363_9APHY|nr:exonuclease [Phanerochaete sordida]
MSHLATAIARQTRLHAVDQRLLWRHARLASVPRYARSLSDAAPAGDASTVGPEDQAVVPSLEGWLFIDSVFPVRLGTLDFRHYVGVFREETLLGRLSALLNSVNAHGLQIKSVEPHHKDGGVFVKFGYDPGDSADEALAQIVADLRDAAAKHGGMPSWIGLPQGNVWLVKGKPWREDMNHYASPIVRVFFEGPDLREEILYDLLRPFGRIVTIDPPTPPPAGTLRSATVTFRHVRSAAIARNTIHGLAVPVDPSSGNMTRLRTKYQQPIQAHVIRDYVSSHPKIFLPIFIFLIGSLTYTIFDPVRVFMVEGKLNDWFDLKEYKFYKWIRSNTIDRFYLKSPEDEAAATPIKINAWKEREDAAGQLNRYLTDQPSTVAFVHGPQGSGKSRMISAMLKDTHRPALVIDVGALCAAGSDAALITGLATQTGYWPVFSFLNSMNSLIDLASVGLIGQKAGLSSSLTDQLKQILEVVGTALRDVNADARKRRAKRQEEERVRAAFAEQEARVRERIRAGTWHDPRLDCVAGNGIMSELGVGDEWFGANDAEARPVVAAEGGEKGEGEEKRPEGNGGERQERTEDAQTIETMPIVILRGFESKGGGARREEFLSVVSQWAASLVEGEVAHVVVVSDNRENAKRLARALPSKPLNLIQLSDADSGSALSFVKQKLHDAGVEIDFQPEQVSYIERLGGRAADLESLIHKIRSGMTVEQAVDDIISRGVSELRKNAFGDDADDAKNLPWTREQAWKLMKELAKRSEIPYHDVLMDFPFKGDEGPLREMEHAEFIAINTTNGRPTTIKPGKPVYRFVFEKLVHDPVFAAVQDIAYNQKIITANEAVVKACEDELMTLKEVEAGTSHWWGSRRAVSGRGEYLLKKMRAAVEKIEVLEKHNATLKKTLSKGH